MQKVRKAVIPVAGYGTRFLPYTKSVPKPMLPVLNIPTIQLITEEAAKSGIEEILFVVGQKKEIIESHFKRFPELEELLEKSGKFDFLKAVKYPETISKVSFATQESQRGTADAILAAKDFVGNEPFAVLFGDDLIYNDEYPVTKQLIDAYEKTGKTIVGCKTVPHKDVPKYASCEYSQSEGRLYKMTQITEKPPLELVKSDLAPLGRYILAPTMMPILKTLVPTVNNEYQLTDGLDKEAKLNGAYAYDFEGTRYDMGNRLGFLKANVEYGLRDEELKDSFYEYLKELILSK